MCRLDEEFEQAVFGWQIDPKNKIRHTILSSYVQFCCDEFGVEKDDHVSSKIAGIMGYLMPFETLETIVSIFKETMCEFIDNQAKDSLRGIFEEKSKIAEFALLYEKLSEERRGILFDYLAQLEGELCTTKG